MKRKWAEQAQGKQTAGLSEGLFGATRAAAPKGWTVGVRAHECHVNRSNVINWLPP